MHFGWFSSREHRIDKSGKTKVTDSFMSFWPQSTYMPRVPQCMSPRPNWDPPTPLPQASLPPGTKGGDTLTSRSGGGGPDSDDWRKSLAQCLLCCFDIQASGSVTDVWKVYFLYIFFLHTSTLFQLAFTVTICIQFLYHWLSTMNLNFLHEKFTLS